LTGDSAYNRGVAGEFAREAREARESRRGEEKRNGDCVPRAGECDGGGDRGGEASETSERSEEEEDDTEDLEEWKGSAW
jgi:hypothetical protein